MLNKVTRVGYVLKTYPRFSETFILNEILAHERAGSCVDIFSLRPSTEKCFHEALAEVRSPLTYVRRGSHRTLNFWSELQLGSDEFPGLWSALKDSGHVTPEDVEQAIELARLVKVREIEHLHAHFGSVAASVTRLAAKMAGVSYSFTAHAKDIFHQDVNFSHLGQKIADAATVVTVSRFNLRYLRRRYPVDAKKIQLVYNGLDLTAFAFEASQERPPLILAVGRLVEKKGFRHLIEACRVLRDHGVEFECEIVGTGRLEDDLAARIAEQQLGDRISLLGSLPQRSMRERLYRARVLAAPCVIAEDADRDGLPTVLLEAMACGTAFVSTDVTGIPEILEHQKTGLYVPQGDAEKLAAACARLLKDAGLRRQLTIGARALVERQFDINDNAALLRGVFPAGARRTRPETTAGHHEVAFSSC